MTTNLAPRSGRGPRGTEAASDRNPSEATFWPKVDQSAGPDGCWPWLGTRTPKGYGNHYVGDTTYRANRLSWMFTNGPIPPGQWVLHRCDNPPCVNPAHLFLGSPRENALDCIRKGRAPQARLTVEDVVQLRARRANGATYDQLAAEFGVSRRSVYHAVTRATWSHVA